MMYRATSYFNIIKNIKKVFCLIPNHTQRKIYWFILLKLGLQFFVEIFVITFTIKSMFIRSVQRLRIMCAAGDWLPWMWLVFECWDVWRPDIKLVFDKNMIIGNSLTSIHVTYISVRILFEHWNPIKCKMLYWLKIVKMSSNWEIIPSSTSTQ